MPKSNSRQQFFLRVSVVIAIATIFLTASFIGVLGLLNGDITGIPDRVPWYLSVTALGFVITIVLLEEQGASGASIITTAIIISVVVFIITMLGVEGMLYAVEQPSSVPWTEVIPYFFAAALIGTGFGFWAIRHWREFIDDASS